MKHSEAKKEFDRVLGLLAYGRGIIQAFTDLLDCVIFGLCIYDEMDLIKNPLEKYDKKDKERMQELLIILGKVTDFEGERFYDALGDLFMEYISQGKNDQYFTPQNVANILSDVSLHPEKLKNSQKVIDSACGSGRLLLGAARHNSDLLFYGSDIEHHCVKMAVINLALNGLIGEIVWANPMTYQKFASYQVNRDFITNQPIIFIKKPENSIHLHDDFKQQKDEQKQLI